jgi:hypothetical protein
VLAHVSVLWVMLKVAAVARRVYSVPSFYIMVSLRFPILANDIVRGWDNNLDRASKAGVSVFQIVPPSP